MFKNGFRDLHTKKKGSQDPLTSMTNLNLRGRREGSYRGETGRKTLSLREWLSGRQVKFSLGGCQRPGWS